MTEDHGISVETQGFGEGMTNRLRNVDGIIQRESEFGFVDPPEEQIYWDDDRHIHACESSLIQRGIRLVWTLCEKDVPANQGYRVDVPHKVTCLVCLNKLRSSVKCD